MKLILTHEVVGLGEPGDIVEVANGYGRNYLLPRGLATAWTRGAEKQIAQIRRARKVREVRDVAHAQEIQQELAALTVRVSNPAGESGRLFGAVTTADVVEAVKQAGGPELDKRRITIAQPIKIVGTHQVGVVLHPEVTATIDLEVIAQA